uniref:Non-specific serine/threonine protein kinase (EC) n=1 Tax=Ganoderma boninense TaxID=34458 RepID=A0A5K1JSL0_9APHY|nr:Non-specific serine/threonine protein kinase (EC [Ganoderma boninense]
MAATTNGKTSHRHAASVSQAQNHKAQLANAYNELGKELSSQKIRVVGNYTLGKVIGEGTYGKVRMGTHRLTGTRVAIKQIPKAMSAALTREIHHHRQLHHRHVTQLYELFDYLAEKGRLNEEETRVLFGQLCLAVAYVHDKGIVHRDLKLENVLLDERCRVKLGDFGFTREFDRGTLLETFCGTTGYAAPEMLLAQKYLGPGRRLVAWRHPVYSIDRDFTFDDDDESLMREKVIKGVYDDPEWLSDEARQLLSGILQVEPTKRLTIAQILTHPWFTVVSNHTNRDSIQSAPTISRPASPTQLQITTSLDPQPLSASTISDGTFHTAPSDICPSIPATPDNKSLDELTTDSHSTYKILTAALTRSPKTGPSESVSEESNGIPDRSVETPSRPSFARADSSSSRLPPAYPTRTPARTKRRSVSSTLSDHGPTVFEKSAVPQPPQDFSSLLHTPAPLIFSTDLERDLLTSMSMLGLDTGQIVHSVLTDACDATGALWWMLKRKAERKALEEVTKKPAEQPAEVPEERLAEVPVPVPKDDTEQEKEKEKEMRSETRRDKSYGRSSQHRAHPDEGKPSSVGRSRESRPPIPPALIPVHSAPELQFIPATPTVPQTKRPSTPPRTISPTNPLLSPTPSSTVESLSKSTPATPSGSKDKDKDNQSSKGRKNRAGSVSIMQRATTALEAAGLVRKKSAEAVREERDRREREEREKQGQKNGASAEEPRSSHGSGSGKLMKTPPMRAVKDATLSSTPPPAELNGSQGQVGSPWILAGKQSPPPDTGSPADTLTSLPQIPARGSKVSGHRNRASLLSTFQRWFREDPKGKRKEDPATLLALTQSSSMNSTGSSPISQRHNGRGTVKGRSAGRGKAFGGGRGKTANRGKRASMSSRRSSSVNSRRSSTSMQYGVLESPPYSASRQRSDSNRRSFGSRTPNSELEEFMSRPSSIHSFVNHPRHRKSPSASSAGSMYVTRTASPLPKNHRRAGSGSSTRVVRQIQMTPSGSGGKQPSHLRSNSASSVHSLQSSRPGSLYDLSETDSRRNSSPNKAAMRRSTDETPRRSHAAFIAHKRQTPFSNPNGSGYLNSLGRSSWKKSWGLEPPGWQTRTAHHQVEVLAVYPPEVPGIRDVFSGRHSLSVGEEDDWVDEDDESPSYVGGLGQMPSSASSAITTFTQAESPLLSPPLRSAPARTGGGSSSTKRGPSELGRLMVGNVPSRAARGKANRSPAGRSSPLPTESVFDAAAGEPRGGRRQLPNGRAGPAFRGIQEEDEDEEE